MKEWMRFLGFILGAVVAASVYVPSAAAEGYVYTREFRGVNSLGIELAVQLQDVDAKEDELMQYLTDIAYTSLRGRLPASVKVYKPEQLEGAFADARVWFLVLLDSTPLGGYYGDIVLQFQRKAYVTPAEAGDKPLFVTVYDNRFILMSGDKSKLKSQLREAADEMILDFTVKFYAARPDLQ